MKTDLIKTYQGRLILPFGTPYIIATAWEAGERYYSQSFALLDCSDHTISLSAQGQSFAKNAPTGILPGSLQPDKALEYCLGYGYDMAYMNVPGLLWNYGYGKMKSSYNLPNVNTIEITLKELENMELVVLSHFLKIDTAAFNWLDGQAQSDILKDLIKTTKGLDIKSTQTYP